MTITALERECGVFCRYLADNPATPYVTGKYGAGLASMPPNGARATRTVDRWLLLVASAGPFAARFADTYARIFRPHGPLRHRLVLLLAILENSPAFHERLDHATIGSPFGILLELGVSGIGFVLRLGVGLVCFGPVQLFSGTAHD